MVQEFGIGYASCTGIKKEWDDMSSHWAPKIPLQLTFFYVTLLLMDACGYLIIMKSRW